jgi:chaperonin cofactor prefoldin
MAHDFFDFIKNMGDVFFTEEKIEKILKSKIFNSQIYIMQKIENIYATVEESYETILKNLKKPSFESINSFINEFYATKNEKERILKNILAYNFINKLLTDSNILFDSSVIAYKNVGARLIKQDKKKFVQNLSSLYDSYLNILNKILESNVTAEKCFYDKNFSYAIFRPTSFFFKIEPEKKNENVISNSISTFFSKTEKFKTNDKFIYENFYFLNIPSFIEQKIQHNFDDIDSSDKKELKEFVEKIKNAHPLKEILLSLIRQKINLVHTITVDEEEIISRDFVLFLNKNEDEYIHKYIKRFLKFFKNIINQEKEYNPDINVFFKSFSDIHNVNNKKINKIEVGKFLTLINGNKTNKDFPGITELNIKNVLLKNVNGYNTPSPESLITAHIIAGTIVFSKKKEIDKNKPVDHSTPYPNSHERSGSQEIRQTM